MSRKTASVLLLASVVGCVREYHPEYHPETTYSYVQNIVTVVPAPPPAVVVSPPPSPALASQAFASDVVGGPFRVRPRSMLDAANKAHPVVRTRASAREVQYAPVFVADDGH